MKALQGIRKMDLLWTDVVLSSVTRNLKHFHSLTHAKWIGEGEIQYAVLFWGKWRLAFDSKIQFQQKSEFENEQKEADWKVEKITWYNMRGHVHMWQVRSFQL